MVKMVLLVVGALLVLGASAADCDICDEAYRVCPDPDDPATSCGGCKAGFVSAQLDSDGSMPCYEAVRACEADKTCSGHGACRMDGECQCDPTWFGSNCEKEILSGGLSEGGLAGVIIGWIIGMLVLLCASVAFYNAWEEDKLPGLPCLNNGGAGGAAPVPQVNFNNNNNNNNNNRRSPQAARSNNPGTTVQMSSMGDVARENRNYGNLKGKITSSGGSAASSAPPVAKQEEMIKTIREVIPSASHDQVTAALKKSNWVLTPAIQDLMESNMM
jgi:hypothetical protein